MSRQSAHKWQWGCQLYASAALYSPEIFFPSVSGTHFSNRLNKPLDLIRLEGLDLQLEITAPGINLVGYDISTNLNDLIGSRARDLPACSIVLQPLRYRVPQRVRLVLQTVSFFRRFLALGMQLLNKFRDSAVQRWLRRLSKGSKDVNGDLELGQPVWLINLLEVSGMLSMSLEKWLPEW
jgi:hypothetical protein